MAVAVAIVAAWKWRGRSAIAEPALPALPALAGRPAELQQRMHSAHAAALDPARRFDGVAELGRLCHANGFSAEAEACWQILLSAQPREARWAYYLADVRRVASDNSATAEFLSRVTELAPNYAPAWLRLGDLQLKNGQLEAAAHAYRRRIALLPTDAHGRLGLARVALQQGHRNEARTQLEQLARDAPEFSPGHNLHAEILAADGEAERATQARVLGRQNVRFREADDPWLDELDDWCLDYERLCVRGTVDFQTKHGDRGKASFERAIRLRPDALTAYELLGNLYLETEDFAQACAIYERALRDAAGEKPPAHFYVNLSRAYRGLHQPGEAERVIRMGMARLGEAYELYDALGTTLLELGEREKGLEALRAATAFNPADAGVHYNFAVALISAHRLDEAVAALHRSLAAQPTFPATLALLAQIEIDSGRLEGAMQYLQPLYESHPELPEARAKMADYHLHAGTHAEEEQDPARAERHYRAGLAIDRDHGELHGRLGILILMQRRFAEAVAPLEAYHRLVRDNGRPALLLGQAYAAVGRVAEARTLLVQGAHSADAAGDATIAQQCRDVLSRLP